MTSTTAAAAAATTTFPSEPDGSSKLVRSANTRLWRAAVLATLCWCAVDCSRREQSAQKPVASARAEVPAPKELVAKLVVPRPAALWKELKSRAGAPLGFVPANVEVLLATLLELPAVAAGSIAGDQPLVMALLLGAGEDAEPSLVMAARVGSGPELVARVGTGADALFVAKQGAGGLTILERKEPGRLALAVLGQHLLAARDHASIEKAGPWLVHTLARRPPPGDALLVEADGAALKGPLSSALSRRWQRFQQELRELDRTARKERGRAPDFADPAALIGAADQSVGAAIDLLASMKQARLRLVTAQSALGFELELDPAPGGFAEATIAELPLGDLALLLELPSSTVLALMLRSTAKEREQAAREAGLGLEQLFSTRLGEKDRERVEQGIAALHEGRGDRMIYGVLSDRTLILQTDVSDQAKLRRGVEQTFDALGVPAIRAPLSEALGQYRLSRTKANLDGVGATRLKLLAKGKSAILPLEALFGEREGRAALVLGPGAQPALAALLGASDGAALASVEKVRTLAAPLMKGAAVGIYADVAGLGLTGPDAGAAPCLFVIGRDGQKASVRLVCTDHAFGALAARFGKP